MTNEQIARLSMYRTAVIFCKANPLIFDKLPECPERLTLLQSIIVQIQFVSEQQKQDKTWITKLKNQLQEKLVVLAVDASRKLTAYARFTQNPAMMGDVNISESNYKHFADSEVKDYAQIVYDHAQSHIDSLTGYSITTDTQADFLDAITSYNAILGDPRFGIVTRSQATDELVELFKTGDAALADIDAAVEIVHTSQPLFYTGYHNARKIIINGTTKLSLMIKVYSAESGDPLKGVSIIAVSDDDPTFIIEKTTAGKGGAHLKSMPYGGYHITLHKPGHIDQTVPININDGETAVLNIKLVKI